VSGVVVLVTMSNINTDGLGSSFALRFLCSRNDTIFPLERTLYPSSYVTGKGRQAASFPENNSRNYSNNANHFMLISLASGEDFTLTTTFIDVEQDKDFYRRFGIDDGAETTRFRNYK